LAGAPGRYEGDPRRVFAQEFSSWPFTEASGTIGCELAGAITFGPSGTAYALNSEAEQGGWPAVDPILRKGGDVTEVLAAAEKICGASS
jgi:hypothetical protein